MCELQWSRMHSSRQNGVWLGDTWVSHLHSRWTVSRDTAPLSISWSPLLPLLFLTVNVSFVWCVYVLAKTWVKLWIIVIWDRQVRTSTSRCAWSKYCFHACLNAVIVLKENSNQVISMSQAVCHMIVMSGVWVWGDLCWVLFLIWLRQHFVLLICGVMLFSHHSHRNLSFLHWGKEGEAKFWVYLSNNFVQFEHSPWCPELLGRENL